MAEIDVPFDHIGTALADAAKVWRLRFEVKMAARGHAVAHEAASLALAFIPAEGATQAHLGRSLGISKQASQQFVDRLCALGLVQRMPDPVDHRAVRVTLTELGHHFVADANEVKAAIEADYRAAMGKSAFAMLKAMLGRLPSIGT